MNDLQYLFNKSYIHIVKQGRSSVLGPVCAYKSDDGCGCAAAPFIINYKPMMENLRWKNLATQYPKDLDPIAVEQTEFVTELQAAHDNHAWAHKDEFIPKYKDEMRRIADYYGLQIPSEV